MTYPGWFTHGLTATESQMLDEMLSVANQQNVQVRRARKVKAPKPELDGQLSLF